MPVIVPGTPSTEWLLGDATREDCVLLAHALPERLAPQILHSGEAKARQTAEVIALRRGLSIAEDSRLAEAVRDRNVWIDDFQAAVVRSLTSEGEPGWEPKQQVIDRFAAAVEDQFEQQPEGDIVVASHGQALSLYLSSRTNIDLVSFWKALTLPDAWRLDLESGALSHLFTAGRPPT